VLSKASTVRHRRGSRAFGAGVVHFGRHAEMRIRQLRRMLNRNISMD
jgi:hypothetical protein